MKILVADDHPLIVEAVKTKLSEIARNVTFVVATNAEELLALPGGDTLDLALVDLCMPGAEGYSHVDELRSRYPALPVVVLSGYGHPELIRSVLQRGVQGFIPKGDSPEVMLSAIRLVLAGGVYVPPMMLSAQPADVTTPAALEPMAVPSPTPPTSTLECLRTMLTERQVAVLELLSEGKPNKLIARLLNISEGTVKIHLAAIFRALNVRNRTEAVIAAQAFTKHPERAHP
ncbi:MAG: response regulator transcription factor [Pseudomonadales bacterium]|nr:response regulator transcription factor [Pseudomonadales bacterium]